LAENGQDNCQIEKLILETTDGETECTTIAAHMGIATTEAQVPRIRTTYGTRPIVTVGPNTEERTITDDAVAGYCKF